MELRFFELYRSPEYIYLLLEGTAVSFSITAVAGFLGFLFAFFLAGLRYFEVPIARSFAAIYVDFIRNTPLIVQLFFIAFGLPLLFGYVWPFWCHALLALSINFSGYFAEILRSGFASTHKGQL
jgi:polar amino acid transport system permease protein